ncbi:MAG: AraC family transcriptional regulator [Acidimicrobiia bacterium]|nr:AraC family transcriptional regulator [Acidimicrobiia bacterium]
MLADGPLEPAAAFATHDRLVEEITGHRSPEPGPLDPRVAEACALMRTHATHPLPVPEVARRVGASPTRLRALFQEQVGLPPSRHLAWWRMIAATRKVTDDGWNLADAAAAGGFADGAHYSRTFRGFGGIPPSFLQHPDVRFQLVERFVQDAAATAAVPRGA